MDKLRILRKATLFFLILSMLISLGIIASIVFNNYIWTFGLIGPLLAAVFGTCWFCEKYINGLRK